MYDQAKQDQLRRLWKLYHQHYGRAIRRFCKRTGHDIEDVEGHAWWYINEGLNLPRYHEALDELTCGAKTRKGTPCKRKDLYRSGRCRLHGGLSTGPTSEEGKRRSAENGNWQGVR